MAADDYLDALVHYRTKFPDKASLGTGSPPDTWKTELDQAAGEAFDAITGTNVTLEGGAVSGLLNFAQRYKVRALHAVRAELDEMYVNPYLRAYEEPLPYRRGGITIRLGY